MSSVVPPACAGAPARVGPRAGGWVSDTTAGSTRITAYPAVAPAPNAGVNTRTGELITPSATASLIASGVLGAETFPRPAKVKDRRSGEGPASAAACSPIILLAWWGTTT